MQNGDAEQGETLNDTGKLHHYLRVYKCTRKLMVAGVRFPPATQRSDQHRRPPFRVSLTTHTCVFVFVVAGAYRGDGTVVLFEANRRVKNKL